jgi:hypothetical protein
MRTLRTIIEGNVKAYHTNMPDFVKDRLHTKEQLQALWNKKISEMSFVELLRYAHPSDRDTYAMALLKMDAITKDEAREFVRFIN